MDNFDLRKFLAKNPLNEAYTPGSGWTQDFDYDDMLAQGLKVTVDTPVEDLEKMFADFEDVNYHREGEHLSYAIDAIKAGDRGEAEMYINKFRKEIKKTIADYSDEYFDVNEGREGQFDVEATERIAQKVADAFTAEDTDLDLKYVVTPGTSENSFDLDVEAGPNTPGDDWKDKNGFGIENYLGDYAGGSFYIKDGVVYNAASRNAKVANVSPEGEVEMISAEDSRADLDAIDAQRKKEREMANVFVREEDVDMAAVQSDENEAADQVDEAKEETKSNKMKKSELKEMIRQAMLAEITVEEAEVYEAEGDEEEVDVEAEETEDVETADVDVDDTETTDVETTAEISPEVKTTQDALTAAIEAAKALGDQKLADQIGNSITFFTRTHVVGQDKVAEGVEMPANVVNKANIAVKDASTMAATMLDIYKQIQSKEQVDFSKNQTFKTVLNYLEKLASQTPAPGDEKEEVNENLFSLRMLKNAGIKK